MTPSRSFPSPLARYRVRRLACRGPAIDPLDWQLCKSQAAKYLAELAARLSAEGVESESVLLEGDPAQEVVQHVREHPEISLLIVSGHGQSGLSGWNVSGVVKKILARANTSSMIVRAYQVVARPEMPRHVPLTEEELRLSELLVDRNRQEAERYLQTLEERSGERVKTRLPVSDRAAARSRARIASGSRRLNSARVFEPGGARARRTDGEACSCAPPGFS